MTARDRRWSATRRRRLAALTELRGQPALIERLVAFEREISVIVVRGQDGDAQVLRSGRERAPERHPRHQPRACPHPRRLRRGGAADRRQGRRGARPCRRALRGDVPARGREPRALLVNEIAPRVHNSGHWTIDACLVSQFENHVRAIAGWPLGGTERHSDAVMTNLIGADVEPLARAWRPRRASPCISTARPRRGPAARWATPRGSCRRVHDTARLDNRRRFC